MRASVGRGRGEGTQHEGDDNDDDVARGQHRRRHCCRVAGHRCIVGHVRTRVGVRVCEDEGV